MSSELSIPPSQATVTVKAINVSNDGRSLAQFFLKPVLAGREVLPAVFFSFLIEHPTSGKRLVFDLGVRKDPMNYPPAVVEMFEKGVFGATVEKDVATLLEEGGIPLNSVNAVIWSHTHLDHIGDISTFPSTTELIIGPGTPRNTYPENPAGTQHSSDFTGRTVTELSFESSGLSIGGYEALDYFDDGSLYILNVPGHFPGHIAALARVTPTTFILCAGDTCHHPGQLRPTAAHHRHFPCPGALIAESKAAFAPQFTVDGDLESRSTPLLSIPTGPSFYVDRDTSQASLEKLEVFDAHPDVFVLIAHDASLDGVVAMFPESMNNWKALSWKEKATWAFVAKGNRAFRFNTAP
ncbi:hypothetical protein BV22DRAFT_1032176 [Leucogyrophana mollusca]|uniref:Uncharacterized protein n=1 Tax=Leucogyrophana mollusca TaxID=85980 RepID=A0ACB8BQQ9_9AGAM|nr:hypothetical protein BV22DRAFT_1032176 [Leucogyrophana mollusca]